MKCTALSVQNTRSIAARAPLACVVALTLAAAVMIPSSAWAIFDDPHVSIPGLRTEAPHSLAGFCAVVVSDGYQAPCLTNADCGLHQPCNSSTSYRQNFGFDEKYRGAAGPIFHPTALVDITGEIFDPITLAAFGLHSFDVRLDSARDANGIGYGRGNYGPLETNEGRRLTCGLSNLGTGGITPFTACTGLTSVAPPLPPPFQQPVYDYRWDLACTEVPFANPGDNPLAFVCTDPVCCPAGDLDLDAPDCLSIGADGVSILGDHSVTVKVQDAAMDRCWPIVEKFPFTVAVPELAPGPRQSERAIVVFKDKSCAGATKKNRCYSLAKVKTGLAFGKNSAGGDDGDFAEVKGAAGSVVPVHIRLTLSRKHGDPVLIGEESINLTVSGSTFDKWKIKSGDSTLFRLLKLRWKDSTRPDLQLRTRRYDGPEAIFETAAHPELSLTMTFGTLPLAPTARVVVNVGAKEFDSTTRGRWKRKRNGRRLEANGAPVCEDNGAILQLDCPAPPTPNAPSDETLPGVDPAQRAPQPSMANMAWNTFAAINWPALDPAGNANNRGIPDLSKSFRTAGNEDLLVWETWKSKREVIFPAEVPIPARSQTGCTIETPAGPVVYRNVVDVNDPQYVAPPICEWAREPAYGSLAGEVYQTSCGGSGCVKTCSGHSPNNRNFHSLDATLQVQTQAAESRKALCEGGIDGGALDEGAPPAACTGLPGQPACCEVGYLAGAALGDEPRSGRPVYTRVWKGTPDAGTYEARQMVVYEVKMNYDSFAHVLDERYDLDSCAQNAADAGALNMPWRSDQDAPPAFLRGSPVLGAENGGVLEYSSQSCLSQYEFANKHGGSKIVEPCKVGSIHVKTAWIPLTGGEPEGKYHTVTGNYFRDDGGSTCVGEERFGLVGMHIVQRTRQRGGATGGTWLFSTFEHVDNETAGFTYSNWWRNENNDPGVTPASPTDPPLPAALVAPPFDAPGTPAGAGAWFPPLATGGITVQRHNARLPASINVNAAAHAELGCNPVPVVGVDPIWCFYELTGIQWQPVDPAGSGSVADGTNDPNGIDQQFWLANLVIETNRSSQFWQGQPPRARVIKHFSDEGNSATLPPRGKNYPLRFMAGGFDAQDRFLRSNCLTNVDDPGGAVAPDLTPTPDAFHEEYKNLAFTKRSYNMGGCIGCHAGAQTQGYSFSYTLAGGQRSVIAPGTDSPIPAITELAPPVVGLEDKTACDPITQVVACPLPGTPALPLP